MTKIAQTQDELKLHLKENLGFLEASQFGFDKGIHAEAKRLATTIRVLVHDTKNSKSLLGLLDLKTNLSLLNTAEPDTPGNLMPYFPLVALYFDNKGPSYCALLQDGPDSMYNLPKSSFDDWWGQIVINDRKGGQFSRKDLVLALANKDGGAHVDPTLDNQYAELSRNNSVGLIVSDGENESPLQNIVLHTVRQISFELLTTLNQAGFTSN